MEANLHFRMMLMLWLNEAFKLIQIFIGCSLKKHLMFNKAILNSANEFTTFNNLQMNAQRFKNANWKAAHFELRSTPVT
jgi:hypothetical protein